LRGQYGGKRPTALLGGGFVKNIGSYFSRQLA
jgi:hypothetical protein